MPRISQLVVMTTQPGRRADWLEELKDVLSTRANGTAPKASTSSSTSRTRTRSC